MITDEQRATARRIQRRTLAAMDRRLPHLPRPEQDALLDATAPVRKALKPEREEQPCRN